jgi:hypothetical protein
LPTVAFFCTCGGLGSERVFDQMTGECGREPVARMVLTERDLAMSATPVTIARFSLQIRAALVQAPSSEPAARATAGVP